MIPSGIIKEAIKQANKATLKHRVGAVIFDKSGHIISSAYNEVRSRKGMNPRYKRWYNTLHAEASAIMKVSGTDLRRCKIFVVRLNSVGDKMMLARPCFWCQEFIRASGIKTVFYSNEFGEVVSEKIINKGK